MSGLAALAARIIQVAALGIKLLVKLLATNTSKSSMSLCSLFLVRLRFVSARSRGSL